MTSPYSLCLTLVSFLSTICIGCASICEANPTYIWPFEIYTQLLELVSDTSEGVISADVLYDAGPLGNTAMSFAGGYVRVPVRVSETLYYQYGLQFYLYVQEDGEILSYVPKAITATTMYISLEISNGNIRTHMNDGLVLENHVLNTTLSYNTWHLIVFVRDYKSGRFSLHFDGHEYRIEDSVSSFLRWPFNGTLTISRGDRGFVGRIACLQILPCADPLEKVSFDTNCTSWREFALGTGLHVAASATLLPTGVATLSPTGSPHNVTTASPSTTTSLTTTSTSHPAGTTNHNGTPTLSPLSPLHAALPWSSVVPICHKFTLTQADAAFVNTSDILNEVSVMSISACSRYCASLEACGTFVYKTGQCRLGKSNAAFTFDLGSSLYVLM